MSRSESGEDTSETDHTRANLLFLVGVALFVYGCAQWLGYAASPPWFVNALAGVGLFAWGVSRLLDERT